MTDSFTVPKKNSILGRMYGLWMRVCISEHTNCRFRNRRGSAPGDQDAGRVGKVAAFRLMSIRFDMYTLSLTDSLASAGNLFYFCMYASGRSEAWASRLWWGVVVACLHAARRA